MAKISVVIPMYNVEKYIDDCLKSMINQTFKDIEIICIDDGSVDNTLNIVNKYKKNDKRINVYTQEHGGVSKARNKGLEKSTGKYIIFFDADDILDLCALEELYGILEKEKLDTIYFDAECLFETDEIKSKQKNYENYYKRTDLSEDIMTGQEFFAYSKGKFRVNPQMQINRTSFLKEHNIMFLNDIIHEDNAFSIEASMYSKRVKHISKAYTTRRLRKGSIMTSIMENDDKKVSSSYGYFKNFMYLYPKLDVVKEDYKAAYREKLKQLLLSSINALDNVTDIKNINDFKNYDDMLYYKVLATFILSKNKEVKSLKSKKKGIKKTIKELVKKNKNLYLFMRKMKVIYLPNILKFHKKVPKISIIIPIYNTEEYLRETLNYLKNQSLKNIEIICIDDESTDGSLNILNEYKEKDKRFKVFTKKHSNAGDARNLGIEKARGEYLLFLDSDDIFDKDLCKKTYVKAKLDRTDVLVYESKRIINGEVVDYGFANFVPINKIFSPISMKEKLFQIGIPVPWTYLYKRDFVLNNNLKFQSLNNANDVFFTRVALVTAKRISCLNEKLVIYRKGRKNSSQYKKDDSPLDFYKAYYEIRKYLIDHNLYKDYYKTFISAFLSTTLYNYNSYRKDSSKKALIDKINNCGSKDFELNKLEKQDVVYKAHYDEFQKIFKVK